MPKNYGSSSLKKVSKDRRNVKQTQKNPRLSGECLLHAKKLFKPQKDRIMWLISPSTPGRRRTKTTRHFSPYKKDSSSCTVVSTSQVEPGLTPRVKSMLRGNMEQSLTQKEPGIYTKRWNNSWCRSQHRSREMKPPMTTRMIRTCWNPVAQG